MNGLVFLCVVVVAASFAQFGVDAFAGAAVTGARVHANGTRRPHCGLGDKWSTIMTDLGTANSKTPVILFVQMDYTKGQQALLNYTGSKTPISQVLIDYNKDIIYSVPTAHPEYCIKTPVSLPLVRKIPDDAEHLGDSFLGPMGAGQLDYDAWRFRAVKKQTEVVYTLAVSKEGCVPIVEGVTYPGSPYPNQLFMFSGFQPKLTDPTAFKLPDSCFK